jgi:hypothetical protein
MYDNSAFLNSIPKFLRRPLERSAPAGKIAFRDRARPEPTIQPHRPACAIHGGLPPVQPDFTARPSSAAGPAPSKPGSAKPAPGVAQWPGAPRRGRALPWFAREVAHIRAPAPLPSLAVDAADTAVVDLSARRDATALAEGAAQRMQMAVQQAFEPETEPGDDDDAAFQVTLPRSVIRQIRMIAANEGTTHRAIVLRALRGAGLDVPAGADVDRRALAAKRRQQA